MLFHHSKDYFRRQFVLIHQVFTLIQIFFHWPAMGSQLGWSQHILEQEKEDYRPVHCSVRVRAFRVSELVGFCTPCWRIVRTFGNHSTSLCGDLWEVKDEQRYQTLRRQAGLGSAIRWFYYYFYLICSSRRVQAYGLV